MDRDPFDLVGDMLDGQVRVVEFAGEGDLSVVYKGHHKGVDAPVAIKCLNLPTTLDGALVRPLVDNFREGSRLHYGLARGNLNIAQCIASGETLAPATGMIVPYLVREWFEGESLRADLERRHREGKKGRSVDETIALLEPAVDAVAYAHGQGALHLSLNPSNLFLADTAGKRALKVLDFGVSRAMNDLAREIPPESRPAGGLRVLFPEYAAPEQIDATVGKVGPSTDVYALALIAMELLSDRRVMSGEDTGALVVRALDDSRRPTPRAHGLELPRNLELVLTRAVARAPERRQKSAKELWNDVRTSLRGTTSRGMPAPVVPPAKPNTSAIAGVPAPAAVAGAVPARRREAPSVPSVETIPMGFQPAASREPSYVTLPALPPPAIEHHKPPPEPDLPPVHVMTTPQPPQVVSPALPPVIVKLDSPLAQPAMRLAVPAPEHPAPEPPVAAAPTFPIIEEPAPSRRSRRPFLAVTAAVIGLCLGIGLVVLFKRHSAARVAAATATATATASATATATATATASATASATATAAGSETATASTAGPPAAHFPAAAAKQALDVAARDTKGCKRGKVWGIGSANVTFAGDGTVSHVAVGVPFTGTPTGQCVADALSTAKVQPFAGKAPVLTVRFVVAPK
jgi:serine/threonine-protein kinase